MSVFFFLLRRLKTSKFFMKLERIPETAMPDNTHMTGARTSIRRTITPYTQERKMTETQTSHHYTYSKIDRCQSIQNDKDVLVRELREAEEESD